MKQLGILDSAFINMEHKNVPQHIGSFGIYDQSTAPGGKVRFKSVIKHFERQIKKIPLFRTRLIQAPGRVTRPYWLVDDNFDLEFHVRHIALPYPGDWRQLCILIARLHSRPIDMSRPLWESYVIEGLKNIDGLPKDCFVIYTKIHHSIVDGGGADNFMAAIHDLEPKVHEDDDAPEATYPADIRPTAKELVRTSTRNYLNNVWNLTKGSYSLTQEVAKSAVKLAKGELKAPPVNAPATRFNNPVSPYRVMEACKFDFEDFRMIKNLTNTKVNDVALAVVSGAMRKYLDAHNEHPETSLVASVPVNMRSKIGDNGDANQVASIFASLNSDIDNPLERLLAIHQSANEAKQFGENTPMRDALKLAGAMSPWLTKNLINTYVDNQLTKLLPLKINTVISNVPGPDFPLYCSGAKLIQYHGLGVLTPGVGIFHLVFTYCGQITITVLADRAMLPDPAFYRQCMEESFQELKAEVKLDQERKLAEAIKLVAKAEESKKISEAKAAKAQVEKAASEALAAVEAAVAADKEALEVLAELSQEVLETAETVIEMAAEATEAANDSPEQPTEPVKKSRKRAASSRA